MTICDQLQDKQQFSKSGILYQYNQFKISKISVVIQELLETPITKSTTQKIFEAIIGTVEDNGLFKVSFRICSAAAKSE